MISQDQIQTVSGGNVVDSDGDKIGSVGQVYLDDQSGNAEWVTVKTGLFGTSASFVPIRDADVDGEDIRVPFSKDKVKDAPRIEDADDHLDHDQERKLYEYYGMDYDTPSAGGNNVGGNVDRDRDRDRDGDRQHGVDVDRDGDRDVAVDRDRDGDRSVTVGDDRVGNDHDGDHDRRNAVGHDTSGPNTDEAMTRSEEQLKVGTETVETGRARLRKYVVTENVTKTVPVSHEEVRIVREPITDENRGDAENGRDLSDEEHEVTLHAEQAVVDKDTVAVERVRLDTETVTGEQEINEEVRSERIETDGMDGDNNRRDNDRGVDGDNNRR